MKSKLMDLHFKFVEQISKLGRCPRLQVGCLLVSMDGERVLAFGYNGNVRGGPNICDLPVEGGCGCVHAEANALVKTRPVEPFAAFITDTPCSACAKLLINAGCKEVYALRRYRNNLGELLLMEYRIPVLVQPEVHEPGTLGDIMNRLTGEQ